MSFRITAEFLNTLSGSPQEWDELNLLADRVKISMQRINLAVAQVRAKSETLQDMCFPLGLAFIEPESIEEVGDLKGLKTDHQKARIALEKSAIGKEVREVTSSTANTELYEYVSRPDFAGGLVFTPGSLVDPDAEPHIKHVALLIPGLGGLTETKPKTIAEVLSKIGYIRSINRPDMPNAVSPSVPLKEAEKVKGTDLPLIALYFKQ